MASPSQLLLAEARGRSGSLPPEVEEGNVEYKRKLSDLTPERYRRLVTQLKWRLSEGKDAFAVYELGVEDDGFLGGLSDEEMRKSLETLAKMAAELQAKTHVVQMINLPDGKQIAEVVVKHLPTVRQLNEIQIAMVGATGAGKSSLLGVLTQGALDNGRGRARLNLLCHRHEIESGRTSSVCREVLGFTESGAILNYCTPDINSWHDIAAKADKLVTFLDLAGDERYFKTTLSGMCGHRLDMAGLVVNARHGFARMTFVHLKAIQALGVPFFVTITQIDLCDKEQLLATQQQVQQQLNHGKHCRLINSVDDVAESIAVLSKADPSSSSLVPIFAVSNVTGRGLNLLMRFLKDYPAVKGAATAAKQEQPSGFEMQIQDVFNIEGVGWVVAGVVEGGLVAEGDVIHVGPFGPEGMSRATKVYSLRHLGLPVLHALPGQSVSLALGHLPPPPPLEGQMPQDGHTAVAIHRGMRVAADASRLQATRELLVAIQTDLAEDPLGDTVTLCSSSSSSSSSSSHSEGEGEGSTAQQQPQRSVRWLKEGAMWTLHHGALCQPATVIAVNADPLDTTIQQVRFRFQRGPECLDPAQPIFCRHHTFILPGKLLL